MGVSKGETGAGRGPALELTDPESREPFYAAAGGRIIPPMKTLMQSNPYLQSAKAREKALYISVKTSSAIEGIRAPFSKARWAKRPKTMDALIAYWKRQSGR